MPTEEGLDEITLVKKLSQLKVKLLKNPSENDRKNVGFQDALTEAERNLKPYEERKQPYKHREDNREHREHRDRDSKE